MSERPFELEIPTPEYFTRQVLCRQACPVRTDAGGYVRAIARGDDEEAYRIARGPNPFASICGRICDAACEAACRRTVVDEAVSIRALKRFVCEQFGPESGADSAGVTRKRNDRGRGRRIAIVGGGPSGLACAHDLALSGFSPTVFEAADRPGGMLTLGIPEYRLPRDLIAAEIEVILGLGVELKTGRRLGRDFGLRDLLDDGFEAVFIGIGAQQGRGLSLEGMAFDGVINALDYLVNRHSGRTVEIGHRVVVVGGGNVALDVARSALRHASPESNLSEVELRQELVQMRRVLNTLTEQAKERPEEMQLAIDAARQALRSGAREVDVYCLEALTEMPASKDEIHEAGLEGVRLHPRFGPRRVVGRDGVVEGIEMQRVRSVFDSEGRFNPVYIEDSVTVVPADTVILAIGQAPDLGWIDPADGLDITPRGTLLCDPDTLVTTNPLVFAGGDVAFGPRNVIKAVAEGRRAAESIAEAITGEATITRRSYRSTKVPTCTITDRNLARERGAPPTLPVEQRVGINEVELPFAVQTARAQADRCLTCHVSPIFDSDLCVACGGCADVCPTSCLALVDVATLGRQDPAVAALIEARYGPTPPAVGQWAAIVKDELLCVHCGLCADRCPVGAITMERVEEVV